MTPYERESIQNELTAAAELNGNEPFNCLT